MEEKFTWVETHKGIVEFLKTQKDNQKGLIQLLKDVGIKESNQKEKEKEISLTMIDPFSFFCYIYKYGENERLKYLKLITQKINDSYKRQIPIPLDTEGVSTIFAAKEGGPVLFKDQNDINILWDFYDNLLDSRIEDKTIFQTLNSFKNSWGEVSATNILSFIVPNRFLPINGSVIPFLVFDKNIIDLEYDNSIEKYLELLDEIRDKIPNKSFYELSAEAYRWYEKNGNRYICWAINSDNNILEIKQPQKYLRRELMQINVGQIILNKNGYIGLVKNVEQNENAYKIEIEWKTKSEIAHQKKKEIKLFKINKNISDALIVKQIIETLSLSNKTCHLMNNETKLSLNQILYGPPGTGKTYNTINRALAIIENKSIEEIDRESKENGRKTIKERFDDYIKEGRIVFSTFHQSMSYEDFIEGIKPETNDKGEINYEVQDGIFKKICKEASLKEERIVNNDNEKEVLTEDFFKGFYSDFANKLPDATEETSSFELETKNRNKFQLFKNPNTGTIIVKAGKLRTHQSVSLKTLSSAYFDNKMPQYPSYSYKIIEEILKDKSIETKALENNQRPYVLIIDEINRGNVSAIFGELITLIEESKRIGQPEELRVKLPYSHQNDDEPFGVPPNLYIIGTMNTADRSVEALDTALRRRFVFEEMMPNYELLADKNIDNVSLKTILETINNRIEVLLSRDHLIGHSYFLEVDSWEKLNETFYKNIIPLLQEYFYGDYGKIGLVLGSGFVKKKNIPTPFAKIDDYDYDFERSIFEITTNNENTIKEAIKKLLNINENPQV
jgi:5-methylcytosine-specific restriction protein B